MATGPNYCNTYEHNCKVNGHLENSDSSRVTWETHDMEVRGHLISAPDLLVSQDSKQRAERMTELQERRRSLQTLLNTRLSELKRVCLQEAELTGEVPNEFPLESGERPPYVRRRVGASRHGPKNILKAEEDEAPHRKQKKTLFSTALRRHTDSEQQQGHGKRTVHRGCHTDDNVRSESSSMSDSTGHDTVTPPFQPEDWSESQTADPDCSLGRKLSPVEVYYEMRTRRNSLASSVSPSRSLPRSVSNLEGRSVPATPLLARTNQCGNIRSDFPGGPVALKLHWSDNHQAQPHPQPLPNQDGHMQEPSDHGNASTGRSNSSEALLDRNTSEEDGGHGVGAQVQRPGMPPRSGPPYKSSEALMEGRLRQVQRSSPERQVNGHGEPHRMRPSAGGRGVGAGGYNEILMDYVWGKQQKMQNQQLQRQQSQGNNQGKARLTASVSTNFNGYPQPPPPPQALGQPQYPSSQPQALHLSGAPPAYSPLMLRGKPGEPRRVKVTRTKSCGPFIPLQQDGLLLSAYPDPITNSYPHPHPQPDQPNSAPPQLGRGPPQYPSEAATPEDATRSLHKALALEGLRDWYLRNTLGHPASGGQGTSTGPGSGPGKGQENGAPHRRRTTASLHGSSQPHTLQHQQSYQGEGHPPYPTQNPTPHLPHSATFHGHPLHGRSVELPLYQDILPTQLQELSLKGASVDQPSPGTLV